jgi:hypothetical protein
VAGVGVEYGEVVAGDGVLRVQPQRLLVGAAGGPPVAEVVVYVGEYQVRGRGLRVERHRVPGGFASLGQSAGS